MKLNAILLGSFFNTINRNRILIHCFKIIRIDGSGKLSGQRGEWLVVFWCHSLWIINIECKQFVFMYKGYFNFFHRVLV